MNMAQLSCFSLLVWAVGSAGCKGPDPAETDISDTDDTGTKPLAPDVFFGFSMVNGKDNEVDREMIAYFDPKWVSLQPHILWFQIEKEPDVYDWSALDAEITWLQSQNLDMVLLHVYPFNTFDIDERKEILATLEQIQEDQNYESLGGAFLYWKRQMNGPAQYDMEVDFFDPTAELTVRYVAFTKAATERYDGDGIDDMPGLTVPIKNHEFEREYSSGEKADRYLASLELLSPTIKEADPEALIIAIGLHTKYGRLFAYVDGFIDDPDAGVWRYGDATEGTQYTKEALANSDMVKEAKGQFEKMLGEGYPHYDVVDFHLYSEKETFIDGLIDYVNHVVSDQGSRATKPIWCTEGGGPFKNAPGVYHESGDPYFGWMTLRENAEWAVKSHVLSAGRGMERQHGAWGIKYTCGGGGEGYWQGPWQAIDDIAPCDVKKPAYYTFKILREQLRDFEVGKVTDHSDGSLRIFEFNTPTKVVYVLWDVEGDDYVERDLSLLFQGDVEVTY
ncbi:MAG: hypothetical protein HN348_14325, partial [Proteobacteria bacterium]|nr:hypothetical protein [Pseudomonadota bacterium]